MYPMEWLPRRRLIFLYLHKIIQLVGSDYRDAPVFSSLLERMESILLETLSSWLDPQTFQL